MGEDAWDEADEARCLCTPLLPAKGNDLPPPRESAFPQTGE